MPAFDAMDTPEPTGMYRREFMSALCWLPSFLDTRGQYRRVAGKDAAPGDIGIDAVKDWAFSAWSQFKQAGPANASQRRPGGDTPVEGFAFVHIMIFLPGGLIENERERVRHSNPALLSRGLGIGGQTGRNASITWVPDRIEDIRGWAFAGAGRPVFPLFRPETAVKDETAIAGRLEKVWFDQWLGEIGVDRG